MSNFVSVPVLTLELNQHGQNRQFCPIIFQSNFAGLQCCIFLLEIRVTFVKRMNSNFFRSSFILELLGLSSSSFNQCTIGIERNRERETGRTRDDVDGTRPFGRSFRDDANKNRSAVRVQRCQKPIGFVVFLATPSLRAIDFDPFVRA